MKKVLTFILIFVIIFSSMIISVNATTLEEELSEQMFYYFDGDEADLSFFPSDLPLITIYDYVEINDIVIFSAVAMWRGADLAEVCEIYGDWCIYSAATFYPSSTSMFVRKENKIYTLQEAWDEGVITDLSSVVGFNKPKIYSIGDADLDYEITILDATQIQLKLAQLLPRDKEWMFEVADYDRDGEATVLDATAIQRKLALIEE